MPWIIKPDPHSIAPLMMKRKAKYYWKDLKLHGTAAAGGNSGGAVKAGIMCFIRANVPLTFPQWLEEQDKTWDIKGMHVNNKTLVDKTEGGE